MPSITLKRRHSLKGKNILPLVRKMKAVGRGDRMPALARLKSNTPLDEMSRDDVISAFRELTGENEKEILEMAQKECTDGNLRLLLHFGIILANEIGEPTGQALRGASNEDEGDTEVDEEIPAPPKKKRPSATVTKSVVKEVESIKDKVRLLAQQNDPSEALILLSLDELAKTARSAQVDDADIFEELYRQASMNQGKINMVNLVLSVMGGKASDVVAKALTKCKKEQEESKDASKMKNAQSPLQNLYQPIQFPYMMPYQPQGMWYPYPPQRPRFAYRGKFNQHNSRPIGPCLFCDAMGHLVKDCLKLKAKKQTK
ncbi:hypothetical protein FSP39_016318 [Pinctada imbricata]|uniref:Uncharacterized protein n=1 Tax=Pinctada imbricata TaxID=66713 RepID=A0AA89C203_PINIB|nr:hypothetical protein FSP39_016318 [Pinctada imbricata]